MTSGSVSGTNGAASYADLRSLGSNRTLVLLNGKRVVQNPFATQAVDLNTLPTSSLERIEVLADGASATYGTDAIAGVINFITRKEYQGLTIGGEAQIPEQGGGEIYLANILGGYGNLATQGWNAYGGLNYRKQQPMVGNERDFMQSSWIPSHGFNGLSPTTWPANYSQSVNGVTTVANTNPTLPGCAPPLSIATPLADRPRTHALRGRHPVVHECHSGAGAVVRFPERLAGAGQQQHADRGIFLFAQYGHAADRPVAGRRSDDDTREPVLPGQRHHPDHQPEPQHDAADFDRMADDRGRPAIGRAGERHAALRPRARRQRGQLGLQRRGAVVARRDRQHVSGRLAEDPASA